MKKLYILFFSILTTSFIFSQEMLLNGNFESWDDTSTPTSYSKAESTTQETTQIHGGTYSAKQLVTSTQDIAQDISGIISGNSYTITIWYKVEAGDGSDARIWSYWLNGTSTVTDANTDAILRGPNNSYFDNNGGAWTQYTATVVAPSGVNGFRWEVRAYNGATVYWDDFSFFAEPPSTDPTLTLLDSETSGGTVTVGPEDLAGDFQFAVSNFVVGEPGTISQGDGYVHWEILNITDGGIHDSGDVFDTSQTYPFTALDPFKTYTLTAELLDNGGASLSTPVVYTLTANTLGYVIVSDIATLRADVSSNGAGSYYKITGASLVTHTDSYFNRHWVQDTNISGILIYDSNNFMTTYNVGDNVTGLKGQTEISNGLLILIPSTDSGIVSSSGNTVTPQIVTIPDFNTNYITYESELVELENVTFDAGDGVATFSTGSNYDVSSDSGANIVIMRTDFFGADYIGQIIPSTQLPSLTAVAGRYNNTAQIYARSLADFTLDAKTFSIANFKMYPNPTSLGYVTLSSKNSAQMSVSLFDLLGKQVFNKTLSSNKLDVSGLNSGIYIMKVIQDNTHVTKKLVIQ